MPSSTLNKNLLAAKHSKNDEYYTQLADIERELKYYKHHFKGKVIYCNCDDPRVSNFFRFFSYNFKKLGLKKLITTCYKSINPDLFSQHDSERAIYLEYEGSENENGIPSIDEIGIIYLDRDGDFRSKESIELLKQSDIVITNPPFSLFREYVAQLMDYDKKFLIIGNINAISYKECFEAIKGNKMWLGYNCVRHFGQPDGTMYETARTYWYTNLDIAKRHEDIILYKSYNENDYPKYDNYDAVEVSKATEIPVDYVGVMGVPITFLDKYNPEQFEILGITDRENTSGLKTKVYTSEDVPNPGDLNRRATIKSGDSYKATYARLLIRRKKI
ncbi:MAG TPA: adenine-specific methyltransferase EcoRI family protein [Mucilaginibacter sp.]|nr:adenine-specific methyltransferase EcoRI family protein [Mucilaginibacter sp.]